MSDSKKRGYHHGNLREALIHAALELIEEAEPYSFTLREAAKRAGVAVSAPYRHFENKSALMLAIAEEAAHLLNTMMREDMARVEGNPSEKFRAMGIAFVKFAVKYPAYFRVLHMPEHVRPTVSERLMEASAENAAMVAEIFEDMSQSDTLGDGLPILQFLAAQSITYGLARMFVDGQMEKIGIDHTKAELLAHAVTGVLGVGLVPRSEDEQIEEDVHRDKEREKELSELLAGLAGVQ